MIGLIDAKANWQMQGAELPVHVEPKQVNAPGLVLLQNRVLKASVMVNLSDRVKITLPSDIKPNEVSGTNHKLSILKGEEGPDFDQHFAYLEKPGAQVTLFPGDTDNSLTITVKE